jgi:hypothetical protein
MGFLRWLRGGSAGSDLMRLEIMMDYSAPIRRQAATGAAAVRWSILAPNLPQDACHPYRAALIALLYAEALVIHAETQASLFSLVDAAVNKYLKSSSPSCLTFDDWQLEVAGMAMTLWPWHLMEPMPFEEQMCSHPAAVGNPKSYTAILKAGSPTRSAPEGLWSFTEMPLGQERVCVPSAPLIAAYAFGLESPPEAVCRLCHFLYHVNRYYERLGRFPLASYAIALGEGMAAFRRDVGTT